MFNITCPYHGQYVIYYNERLDDVRYPKDYSAFAYNDLCELEVYGTYGYSLFVFSRLKGQARFSDRNLFEVFHRGDCHRCCYISFNIFSTNQYKQNLIDTAYCQGWIFKSVKAKNHVSCHILNAVFIFI